MAASGLVQEDPDHIFIMMEFLFDIKKVCPYSSHDDYILLINNTKRSLINGLNVSLDSLSAS